MALILVVDDDLDVLRTFENSLKRDGHQVVCASDGAQVLDSSFHPRPDLILLDIAIPGINGIELCRRLRSNPTTASIPILFVTVSGDIESKIAAFDAGADDYLVKPFDLQELNLRIRALLVREENA